MWLRSFWSLAQVAAWKDCWNIIILQTHNVPLADVDSGTPLEWSQIKGSEVKFFSLLIEKAVSRMKSTDRPQALMKFNTIYSDLALN